MHALTTRQREILSYLTSFSKEKGSSPSLYALMERFRFKSTNAPRKHLLAIEKKGYIRRPLYTTKAGAPIQILRAAA